MNLCVNFKWQTQNDAHDLLANLSVISGHVQMHSKRRPGPDARPSMHPWTPYRDGTLLESEAYIRVVSGPSRGAPGYLF